MVGLSGTSSVNIYEGINGAGAVSATDVIVNTESASAPYPWLGTGNGGYAILTPPSIGTLTATQDTATGEGSVTWVYSIDSDDPALDALDDGDSMVVTFTIRVTDLSWSGVAGDYVLAGGTVVGETFTVSITIFGRNEVCFTRGTEIETPDGPRRVEELAVGDLVLTRDNGPMPLRWVGKTHVSKARRLGNSALEPVSIAAGAIKPGVPNRDLKVSPQHRILLDGYGVDLLFAEPVMLASAKSLINNTTIRPCGEEFESLDYWHLMFEDHEVVFANGCPTESLYLGDVLEDSLSAQQLEELRQLFPNNSLVQKTLAFPQLKPHEVATLMALPEQALQD